MTFRMTTKAFRQINAMPSVRARCRFVAAQVAGKTRANLAAAGVDADVTTETGTRKDGRTFARVQHSDRFGEYGTQDITRHRALGRAIGSKRL